MQLAAWEESRHFYTDRELAALELTEAVTVLTGGTSQRSLGELYRTVYGRAAGHFEEAELAHLIASITVINAWNRFGVTCRLTPGHYRPGSHA
ncbi:carboxymuconolactone decarboxylase family protein [Streptomyces hirsutus]